MLLYNVRTYVHWCSGVYAFRQRRRPPCTPIVAAQFQSTINATARHQRPPASLYAVVGVHKARTRSSLSSLLQRSWCPMSRRSIISSIHRVISTFPARNSLSSSGKHAWLPVYVKNHGRISLAQLLPFRGGLSQSTSLLVRGASRHFVP